MKDKCHKYSSDTNERQLVHVYLAMISVLLSYVLYWITQNTKLVFPWWVDAPAIFGFYGIIYLIFKKRLWNLKIFRFLFSIATPDWNGTYTCNLKSSYDNFQSEKEIKVRIKQEWDMILIQLTSVDSKSNSLSGAFSVNDSITPQFTYEYLNKPFNDCVQTMNIHYGIASIWFESGQLYGEFFNGRGRNNFGVFKQIE
jgi:hypothetical protein